MTLQRLFTPFRLGHVTLRNRIVSTPHATRFGKDGYVTERYIRYHAEKARGGAGLVQCFGSSSVHPSSPVLDWNGIKNWDDSSLPTFEAFARAIHAEGAHVMAQTTHRGRRGSSGPGERALVSPSDVPETENREIPHALDRSEIAEIVQAYAAAALRLKRAGFDGADLCAYARHLIDQFWVPVRQPADRRVRGQPREPPPVRRRGRRGHPRRRRARLRPGDARQRRRADPGRAPSRGRGRDRPRPGLARPARLLHGLGLDRRDPAVPPEADAVRRRAAGRLRVAGRPHQAGGAGRRDLRGPGRRPAPRGAPPRRGRVRPGRDDAGADGRPVDAAEGGRGATSTTSGCASACRRAVSAGRAAGSRSPARRTR